LIVAVRSNARYIKPRDNPGYIVPGFSVAGYKPYKIVIR